MGTNNVVMLGWSGCWNMRKYLPQIPHLKLGCSENPGHVVLDQEGKHMPPVTCQTVQ